MFTHTSTKGFSLYLNSMSSAWLPLYMAVPFIVKTAVPIFFMISGALLLGRDEPLSVIFRKRICRFAAVLVIFSFLNYLISYRSLNIPHFLFLTYTSTLATAYYFLYIYIGFLLMLPFWRAMVKNLRNKDFSYLFCLSLIFYGLLPTASYLMFKGTAQMNYFLNPLWEISEPVFYFLLGYWIEHVMPAKWMTRRNILLLTAAAAAGIALSALMTLYHGRIDGGLTETSAELFYYNFLPVTALAVYCGSKYFFLHCRISDRTYRFLVFLGSMTFGIMLLDDILRNGTIRIYQRFLLPAMPSSPLLAAILWITGAFALGAVITYFMKKLPVIKKLI